MIICFFKVVMVLVMVFFVLFVVFGNIIDYVMNFVFVYYVFLMDIIFLGNGIMYCVIDMLWVYYVGYIGIILMEMFMVVLCWIGGVWLLCV